MPSPFKSASPIRALKPLLPGFNSKTQEQIEAELQELANAYRSELIDLMPRAKRNRLRSLYKSLANKQEDIIVSHVLGYIDDPRHIAHFLMGAHIQLEGDDAQNYERWHRSFRKIELPDESFHPGWIIYRQSSHASVDEQIGIDGNVVGHILMGTRYQYPNEKQGKYTWIQIENNSIGGFAEFMRAPLTALINAILHFIDFLDYKFVSRQNIARWGKSEYTEENPLQINISNISAKLASERSRIWRYIILDLHGDLGSLPQEKRDQLLNDMHAAQIKLPERYDNNGLRKWKAQSCSP